MVVPGLMVVAAVLLAMRDSGDRSLFEGRPVSVVVEGIVRRSPGFRNTNDLATLKRLGLERAVPALIPALERDSRFVSLEIPIALGSVGICTTNALPALIKAWEVVKKLKRGTGVGLAIWKLDHGTTIPATLLVHEWKRYFQLQLKNPAGPINRNVLHHYADLAELLRRGAPETHEEVMKFPFKEPVPPDLPARFLKALQKEASHGRSGSVLSSSSGSSGDITGWDGHSLPARHRLVIRLPRGGSPGGIALPATRPRLPSAWSASSAVQPFVFLRALRG